MTVDELMALHTSAAKNLMLLCMTPIGRSDYDAKVDSCVAAEAALRSALEQVVAAAWQPISTAPKNEGLSFLVYRDIGLEMSFAMQVSVFEGELYPDHLCGNVDWSDRVTNATHWKPLTTPTTAARSAKPGETR